MRGIDYPEARSRVRIAEVLTLMRFEPWTLSLAPLPQPDEPGIRRASGEERLSLFSLRGAW